MKNVYAVGPVIITAALGWVDITKEIEAEGVPFTLAKPDGVGALQFSTAAYKAGRSPAITIESLRRLLLDFAMSRELGRGSGNMISTQPLLICAASYNPGTDSLRVWYCSNGQDLVLATYTCEYGAEGAELADCEDMIANLRFRVIDNL